MTMRVDVRLSAKWGRLLVACLCTLLLCLPAAAAQTHRFGRLADTVFSYVTRENGLPNEIPLSLAQDSDGFLWTGTEGGLARWDGTHFKLYVAGPGPTDLPDNVVSVLHRDTLGRLWIGTDAASLARYDPVTDAFVRVPLDDSGGGVAGVQSIIDDGSGGLWVGTGAGLYHLDASMHIEDELTTRQTHAGSARPGLPDFSVAALLRDRSGAIWVGTLSGLARAAPGSTKFVPFPLPVPYQGDATVEISGLMEDHTGTIWVGTGRNGAFIIGPDGGPARPAPLPADSAGPVATYGVKAMLEIQPGIVWLGTDGQGILDIQQDQSQPRSIRHDNSISTSLLNDMVRALYKDRSGLVWVATDRGISRYDPRQHAVATLFGVANRADGLSDPDILSILPMPDGKVWIGTHYHGIDTLDPATAPSGNRPAGLQHWRPGAAAGRRGAGRHRQRPLPARQHGDNDRAAGNSRQAGQPRSRQPLRLPRLDLVRWQGRPVADRGRR
jgi:ligand-binding sensor domain-containing protein